jgi:hypothetical protein
MVKGKHVAITLANVDPVSFKDVSLAAGPSSNYPEAVVNGQLIYSYETDNWFTSLTLAHSGAQDRLSGGMKWVKKEGETGGRYELNILFNDEQASHGESAAFETPQGEDAFFMGDPNKSTVNGAISIAETHLPGVERTVKSNVKYGIGLQRVTPQQAQALWKTLLLIPSQLYGE